MLIAKKCGSATEWENTTQQWYNWLCEMKKKDEERRMDVEHQKLASRMIRSAEARTGLHKITKATAWRGGVQIPHEEEEDVEPSARLEEKKERMCKPLAV